MATDATLKSALRRFGLSVETHIGAPWTYSLPKGDVLHLCWQSGPAISWPKTTPGILTYRDTFDDFDSANPSANALQSFALLGDARAKNTTIRCILVSGSKASGTRYAARPELLGTVTLAIPEPGKGIEIVFRRHR
jgi:hypothetical protein